MRFPNAARGIKKIFAAEILGLILAPLSIVATILGLITVGAVESDADVAALSLGIPFLITLAVVITLIIVRFVVHMIGVINASHDDPAFKTALYFLIIGIVCSVVSAFTQQGSFISSFSNSLAQLAQFCTTMFVIQGVINTADKLNNAELSAKGKSIFKLIAVMYIILFCVTITSYIFGANPTTGVIAIISLAVAGVMYVVQYIMYLSFLSKAYKMLANA